MPGWWLVGSTGRDEVPGVYGQLCWKVLSTCRHECDDGKDADTGLQTSFWAQLPWEGLKAGAPSGNAAIELEEERAGPHGVYPNSLT